MGESGGERQEESGREWERVRGSGRECERVGERVGESGRERERVKVWLHRVYIHSICRRMVSL